MVYHRWLLQEMGGASGSGNPDRGIDVALQNHSLAVPIPQNVFPLMDMPKLSDISLQDKTVSDEEYSKRLKELQENFESCTTAFTTKRFLSSLHTKVGMLPEKAAISSV